MCSFHKSLGSKNLEKFEQGAKAEYDHIFQNEIIDYRSPLSLRQLHNNQMQGRKDSKNIVISKPRILLRRYLYSPKRRIEL